MDVYGIEALLALPEFRVMDQVIGPKRLDLHLERRDTSIVCPRCQTWCSRVQDSRPRRIRDLPILERPVLLWLHLGRFECQECDHRPWEKSDTFSAHVKWTERLYQQVRAEFLGGCPGRELARRYGLSERTVFRWTFERSRGGRPRKLGRAIGIDEYSRRKGHRYNTSIVDLDKGRPIATFKCLSKMDFIFVAEPFDHPFDILNQAGKVGISPEFDPFVLHKTPKNLYEIQFGRICRQVENP